MAFLAPAATWLFSSTGLAATGVALGGAGLAMSASAASAGAKAANAAGANALFAGEAEAKQLETRAKQGVAVGSYNSDVIAARARDIISSQRARAAAGGGDTTDQTVRAITDETIKRASMEQLLTMAEAEDRARQDRYSAQVARTTGAARAESSRLEAKATRIGGAATVLSGAGQLGMGWAANFGAKPGEP